MHLLPGLLGLLLLAAPCAADERVQAYSGNWAGTITVSPSDCEWQVKLLFTPAGGALRGSFTYSGPCGKTPGSGSFNADDQPNSDCMKAMVSLPGLPGMNGEACFESDDTIVFKSGLGSGTLSLSEGGTKADLEARSLVGSAEGAFIKVEPKKARKPAKKGKKDGKKGRSAPPKTELYIGGY
jgi:hypothetical protein